MEFELQNALNPNLKLTHPQIFTQAENLTLSGFTNTFRMRQFLIKLSLLVGFFGLSVAYAGDVVKIENTNTTKIGVDSAIVHWNTIIGAEQTIVRFHMATNKSLSEEEIPWVEQKLPGDATKHVIKGLTAQSKYVWQIGAKMPSSDEIIWGEKQKFKTKPGFGFFQILIILGALGFFIFGMKVMSEGIQKLAGGKLREILSAMTNNRVSGVFTGFFTTSLIQSSSATTVMIVSFVNAGLLNLRQAIGVIMGANIGTTMTAWLLVLFGFSKFSLSNYALPIIAIGLPLLFVKKSSLKALGEFLVGFALLFMGLSALKEGVEVLELDKNQEFINWINGLGGNGFISTLLFVLIGTILTIIVQSSSAAMALTLTFVSAGLSLPLAAAIVLGENIGTTITANLAALIGNVHAKRAARAHLVFNIFGVIWMLFFFHLFLSGISNFMATTEWGAPLNDVSDPAYGSAENKDAVRISLALFHTCFNIINTLILIWFVNWIAKIVVKMTPSKGDDDTFNLEYIGTESSFKSPELSLLEVKKEVAKFGKITAKLSGFIQQLLVEHNAKQKASLLKRVEKYEEITDRVEVEVANYLSRVSEGNLTEETTRQVRGFLSIVNDLERIGDIYFQMSKIIERKSEEKVWFAPEQREKLLTMMKKVDEAFEIMITNLNGEFGSDNDNQAHQKEDEINEYRNYLRKFHLESIENKDYNVKSGMVFNEMVSLTEKVGDHIINVSEAMAGEI